LPLFFWYNRAILRFTKNTYSLRFLEVEHERKVGRIKKAVAFSVGFQPPKEVLLPLWMQMNPRFIKENNASFHGALRLMHQKQIEREIPLTTFGVLLEADLTAWTASSDLQPSELSGFDILPQPDALVQTIWEVHLASSKS